MTKTPKLKNRIEYNREIITYMLSGTESTKRLNNVNWLRHEISYTEPRTLFYIPNKEQQPYLDFNCMRNLGLAYDYILQNPNEEIDEKALLNIHSILCTNPHIDGARYRTTEKFLEIKVNGMRMSAPKVYEVPQRLNEIFYTYKNSKDDILHRAFKIHYELIALQPFDDFNKRTARLIMNWILVQGGYRPIVFNRRGDKQKYKEAIANYANGNKRAYYSYMQSCMVRTQEDIIKLLTKSRTI